MIHVSCFEVDLWKLGTSLSAAQTYLYGTVEHQQSKTTDGVNWQEFGGGSVFAWGSHNPMSISLFFQTLWTAKKPRTHLLLSLRADLWHLSKKTLPGGMLSGLLGSQNDTSLGGQHSSSDWDLLAGET